MFGLSDVDVVWKANDEMKVSANVARCNERIALDEGIGTDETQGRKRKRREIGATYTFVCKTH